MSFAIAAVAVAAISTGYSIYSGERAADAQKKAQSQARLAALKQEKAAEEANNRANQKKADTIGALASAQQSGRAGPSGTMLTGAQGIDPSLLTLGKATLLGG